MTALNFPDSPTNGEVYEGYIYDSSDNVWNRLPEAPGINLENLGNVTGTPTAGQKLVFDGTNWVNLEGYVYVDTVYFTSSGTFTKADYPWLRAIRVKCLGGGGAGGGAAVTSSTQVSAGVGGNGGAFAESFITDIAGLDASVTVTRGSGGAGVAAATGNSGGNSSFGALVIGGGGVGGSVEGASGATTAGGPASGSLAGSVGDFTIPGGGGGISFRSLNGDRSEFRSASGAGGSSVFGSGGGFTRTNLNGLTGVGLGAGGSGGLNTLSEATNKTGGAGTNGIVIVELYA